MGLLAAGVGLGAVIALTIIAETSSELAAPGGVPMFLGNLTAMVGTYLALLMVLLVSRIPSIERSMGQDRLVRWHRRLSPWPLGLIAAHVVLTTVGYAEATHSGLGRQMASFWTSYPDVAMAMVAFGIMAAIAVASLRAIRARLRRETWWTIHLWMYMALALAFLHEIALGPSFVGHPLARVVWIVAWLSTAGLVIGYRIGLPIARSFRHRIRVVETRKEGPGVTSIICKGRNLERLCVSGGQFMLWRFLAPGIWWQAHPYSLSAMPRSGYLRLTVKQVGDHSSALSRIRPGTPVMVEGPYGAFTRHVQRHQRALLVAGGIGVTALRSLLEDLPGGQGGAHPVVIVRSSRPADLVLRSELATLVRHKRGSLHEIVGSREEVRFDEAALREIVPDISRRDVYVCGPEGFVERVAEMARRLGVDADSIHHEAFSL